MRVPSTYRTQDLRVQLHDQGCGSSGVVQIRNSRVRYEGVSAGETPRSQSCKIFANPKYYFASWWKKRGEAPKYVQTGCNKCFQRYTPESWVLKGKDRSVTGGGGFCRDPSWWREPRWCSVPRPHLVHCGASGYHPGISPTHHSA